MRKIEAYLFRAAYSKGVSNHHLHLAEAQAGRRVKKLHREQKTWLQACSNWRLLAQR